MRQYLRDTVVFTSCYCSFLTLSGCHERNEKAYINGKTYTSSSISVALEKNDQSQTSCPRNVASTVGIKDHDGSHWVMGKKDWCEYKAGTLVASWSEAISRSTAERLLKFSGQDAYLDYIPPAVGTKTGSVEGRCVEADTVAQLRKHVPAFDNLQLCESATSGTHQLKYRLLRATSGPIPVLSIEPLGDSPKVSVLYLFGGPFANPFSGANLSMLAYVSQRRDVRIEIPIYMGIGNIRVTDATNLDLAQQQVEYLVKKMIKAGDRVCAIGGSLGGYLLAGVDLRGSPRLLVNPLLDAPREAQGRMAKDPRFTNEIVRLTEMSLADWLKPALPRRKATDVPRSEAFVRYFGPSAEVSLSERLKHKSSPVEIVYGGRDIVIGLYAIPQVKAELGDSRVRNVGPVEHAAESPENFWAFERSLDKFLDKCARKVRPSRNRNGAVA